MPYTYKTTGTQVAADFSAQISGKVVLTTGVSPGGLGGEFVTRIAEHNPKLLILASRNLAKAQKCAEAISAVAPDVKTRLLELDLASMASVRKAAGEVMAYTDVPAIDVLCLNAGIMAVPYAKTVDGLESQFGANHIGHFLFVNLIMDKVLRAQNGGRVVSVSSFGHKLGGVNFADLGFGDGKTYNPWRAYGQAKTANMLFAVSLAEKLGSRGLTAVSLHPGGVAGTHLAANTSMNFSTISAFGRLGVDAISRFDFAKFFLKSLDQGVATHVRASFDPALKEHNGGFLEESELVPENKVKVYAKDKAEAERLWKASEEIVGQKFTY